MKVDLKDGTVTYLLTDLNSENIGRDKKGYLICRNVQIARSGKFEYPGKMVYGTGHLLSDEVITIERPSKEVFDPKTLASIESAAFTKGHPQEGNVNSMNSSYLLKGWVKNARKGSELDDNGNELLLADIIVADEAIIKEIENGKREVSIGYSNDLDTINGDGKNLLSKNLRINHVALVNKGRAKTAFIVDGLDNDIKELDLSGEGGVKNMADKSKEFTFKSDGRLLVVKGCEMADKAEEYAKEFLINEKNKKEEK